MKHLTTLILFIFLSNPVLVASERFADTSKTNYTYQEIPVKSPDLDSVSDTYKIEVKSGSYKIANALSVNDVKHSLIVNYKHHKIFIFAALEVLATLFCPVLVPALQEAYTMQDDDGKINSGEVTIILVPVGCKPELFKE